jgi:hypothetical protein
MDEIAKKDEICENSCNTTNFNMSVYFPSDPGHFPCDPKFFTPIPL